MRHFPAYCRRVIWTALPGSLSAASTWGLVVFGLCIPLAIWLFGEDGGLTPAITFWMSWGLLATVVGLRLIWAPFEIYREQANRISDLERQPDIRRDVLHGFFQDGLTLLNERLSNAADLAIWRVGVDDWTMRLRATLTEFYGAAEAGTVVDLVTVDFVRLPGSFNGEHNQKRVMLSERIKRVQKRLATQGFVAIE